MDALNKHAYLDDSQVAVISAAKVYSDDEAKTQVRIRYLGWYIKY